MDRLLRTSEAVPRFDDWLRIVTPGYRWDWAHLAHVRSYLDKVTAGEIDRLMLFLPPRHGKSEMTTVRYPVWRLEREPGLRIIVGAYNQVLANRFSRKSRGLAEGRIELNRERTAVEEWETVAGGSLRAVGVGAGVTGYGGDLIVVDDPIKNREEANSPAYRGRVWDWYTDDLYTRLEPGAAMVLIMTRWHHDDLAGRILESEDAEHWTVVSLPAVAEDLDPLGRVPGAALCPERYDERALARIKRVLGTSFEALFQQRPGEVAGETFKGEWFRRYAPGEPPGFGYTIQSWDTAFKETASAAFSAATTWGHSGQGAVLLEAWREKVDWPGLALAIGLFFLVASPRPRKVLIEDKASGQSAVQQWRQGKDREALVLECQAYLRRGDAQPALVRLIEEFMGRLALVPRMIHVPVVAWSIGQGGKLAQAEDAAVWYQAGQVWHPVRAPWLAAYEREMTQFPTGKYADWVDSSSQAVLSLLGRAGGSVSIQDL